ncbi:MAG: hypothetical protein KDA45_10500, partial [Planctomycetales bacterium]|nr:hypothetical protein [Planctomycetales bacterium]
RSAEYFAERFTMPLAATSGGQDTVVPAASVLRLLTKIRQQHAWVLGIHRPAGGHSSSYEDTRQALEFVLQASGQPESAELPRRP